MRGLTIGVVGLVSAAALSLGGAAARAETPQASLTAGVGTVTYEINPSHYGFENEGPFVISGAYSGLVRRRMGLVGEKRKSHTTRLTPGRAGLVSVRTVRPLPSTIAIRAMPAADFT